MSFARAPWGALRLPTVLFLLASLGLAVAACDSLPFGAEPEANVEDTEAVLSGSFGACNPWYDRDVVGLDMSEDGQRWVYLSGRQPGSLPEDTSWRDGSRALYLRDGEGDSANLRVIALPWEAVNTIPAFATPDASGEVPPGQDVAEVMQTVQISEDGQTVAIGVLQSTLSGGLAKIYVGSVPAEGDEILSPGAEGGLVEVPLNSVAESERIQSFALSDDGTKVAATVGERGELRVYDLAASQLYVYSLGEDNAVEVSDELPPASTTIANSRRPAIISDGGDLEWSPEGDRVAVARSIPVSKIYVHVVNVEDGESLMYAETGNATAPHVAWASDGGSVYVMSTELAQFETFGKTVIRHLEAEGTGTEIGGGASIDRPVNWRTEPAHLTSFGDDATFLFVWEGQLWRLDVPDGDLSQASYQQVTVYGEGTATGGAYRPAVSLAADSAISIVADSGTTKIGQRTEVTASQCSEAVAPAENEGEGDGEAEEGGEAESEEGEG